MAVVLFGKSGHCNSYKTISIYEITLDAVRFFDVNVSLISSLSVFKEQSGKQLVVSRYIVSRI